MQVGSKYRLGARIGGGGMAEVFEATLTGAEGFSRPVAIKRMLPALSADPAFGQMFVNEAQLASLLHHPSIASVLDFDRDEEGRYYLVMELIRGVDLRTLTDTGPLPISVSLHIAAELLRGLDYAHELVHNGKHLKIVHRDVSPHNVMLSFSGGVKLVDFGIAKAVAATGASRTGSLKGKVAYMSPEQAHGHSIDGRTDVFAIGVILHELLTGHRLFRGATEPEILARLLTQPIGRPSESVPNIPADVDAAVMSMLARDPNQRVPNAHAALERLLHCDAMSPRAGLELRALLAERFPERAPDRGSGANAMSAAPMPLATAPETPLARAAAVRTPPPKPRSQIGMLIAAAVISVAAIAVALVIRAGRGEAVQGEVDAGAIATAAVDAQRAPPPSIDAAIIAAAKSPDAAPIKADTRDKKREREAERKEAERKEAERKEAERKEAERKEARRKEAERKEAHKEPATKELGQLKLTAKPWAKVSVGGKSGRTPFITTLPAGSYQARWTNSELGATRTVTVTVKPNRMKTYDVDLREKK